MCYVKNSVKGSKIHHISILRMLELEVRIISADLAHSSKVTVSTRTTKNVSNFNHGMYVVCTNTLALQWNLMKCKSNLWKEKGETSHGPRGMKNVELHFSIAWGLQQY